jgi:hypothetical protein
MYPFKVSCWSIESKDSNVNLLQIISDGADKGGGEPKAKFSPAAIKHK